MFNTTSIIWTTVVGGGSSGCVVAARLAEQGASVLLLGKLQVRMKMLEVPLLKQACFSNNSISLPLSD